MNFAKFLRTAIFKNTSGGCFCAFELHELQTVVSRHVLVNPMFTHIEALPIHLTNHYFGKTPWFQYRKFYSHFNSSHSLNTPEFLRANGDFTWEKESVFGLILVRIFSAFSRIRTEYGEIRSKMQENAGKMRTRITPNTDTFYAVFVCEEKSCLTIKTSPFSF